MTGRMDSLKTVWTNLSEKTMIFVVAIDPESIALCGQQGALGCDHLIGVLQALTQNCLIAEASGTWRLSKEFKEAVKSIPDQGARKIAVAMLEKLMDPNHFRFVEVIHGFEEDYETAAGVIVAAQTDNPDLDAIICEQDPAPGLVEAVSIVGFNQSNFARTRSRKACALLYAPGNRRANAVLDEAFGRLIRHSDKVSIFDRVMGKEFGPNYFEALCYWCEFFRQGERNLLVHFHTTRGQEKRIKEKLAEEFDGTKIAFDVVAHEEQDQPHERFLRAGGFTLDIGRGVDLFDRSGDCRDVKIGISDYGAFTREWGHLG